MKRIVVIFAFGVLLCAAFSSSKKPPSIPNVYINPVEVSFEQYPEYQDYISEEPLLPEGFITADMLKEIGTFQFFASVGGKDPLLAYYYKLLIENDVELTVSIYHNDLDFFFQKRTVLPQWCIGGSMLNLKERLTGCIFRNGIMYSYKDGRLGSIYWTVDNAMVFQASSFYNDGEKYLELPEESLIYRLLSASEEEQFSAARELLSVGTQ